MIKQMAVDEMKRIITFIKDMPTKYPDETKRATFVVRFILAFTVLLAITNFLSVIYKPVCEYGLEWINRFIAERGMRALAVYGAVGWVMFYFTAYILSYLKDYVKDGLAGNGEGIL